MTAGVDDEFVCVGRLDNLAMSFCSLQALLDCYRSADSLSSEDHIKAVALFDHEEVGSSSAQGTGSGATLFPVGMALLECSMLLGSQEDE